MTSRGSWGVVAERWQGPRPERSARAAGARVVGITRTLGPERLAAADELVERIDLALLERILA